MFSRFVVVLGLFVLSAAHSHSHGHGHSHFHADILDPPPPEQDQCHPVNASEPRECPDHIGPPCPPCYTNFRPDYSANDASAIKFTAAEKESVLEFMAWYENWWAANYPPTKTQAGYDVFSGSAGRGNIFLRSYLYSNKNQTLLNIATAYINHALGLLPRTQSAPSYFSGSVGVWTLKAVIDHINGDTNSMNEYLGYVHSTFVSVDQAIVTGASHSSDGIDMSVCDLDSGLAGLLYNGLLINKYFSKEIIDVNLIRNLTLYVLDEGIKNGANLQTDYLQYECTFIKGCYLWGPGHGNTGVIYTVYTALKQYPQQLALMMNPTSKYYLALRNTMDFFVSVQLADGNIPTNTLGTCSQAYGTDDDARVQWCHGAPGFINVFMQSTVLFAPSNASAAEAYLHAAMRTANVTWDRGLLVKGTMYCHGIAGNANMLWELAQLLQELQSTGSAAFLQQLSHDGYDLAFLMNQSAWRAKQFVIWTLNWSNIDKTRIYDSNEGYSMYQGNFAIPMLYIQTLQDGWPMDEPVCHPGWNLCV